MEGLQEGDKDMMDDFNKWAAEFLSVKHRSHEETYYYLIIGFLAFIIAGAMFCKNVQAEELIPAPTLVSCTAYYEGEYGSHGDRMREGYCAMHPDAYGKAALVYEALPDGDGGYKIGNLIYTLEIRDTGYGHSLGWGSSSILEGKHVGSIEDGQQIDIYRDNFERCVDVMERTQGKVFVQVLEAEG